MPIKRKTERIVESPLVNSAGPSVSAAQYEAKYPDSIKSPEVFWAEIAGREIEWFSPWLKVLEGQSPEWKWFVGGKLNITHNCLDRHVKNGLGDKAAFIWSGENGEEKRVSYRELLDRVNKFANGLKSLGVKKGDRVVIFMPLIIEQAIAMLACARIGAIHSVLFTGFSAEVIKQRILDSEAKILIVADYTLRRGKNKDLLERARAAASEIPFLEKIVVFNRDQSGELKEKEMDFIQLLESQSKECAPEPMDAEDILFILYTSGSTGKPKGIVHSAGGYNVFSHYTTKIIFDAQPNDIFWCTADPGWITGHSYVVYGPLSVGLTSVMAEGAPDFPAADQWWKIIEKYKINIFYTSPTAIRLLRSYGDSFLTGRDLSSLRILGSVGEPINPDVWEWFYEKIGQKRCVLVDTWWQTETGGHMIVALPCLPQKPGKAGKPFFGVRADIVDKKGDSVPAGKKGQLVIRGPWPSSLRQCWKDRERFLQYWNGDAFFTGDMALRDEDGYIQILGRADDVLNVSGHLIGTGEIENALLSHPAVAEAAAIGKPHFITGQTIKAFVCLCAGQQDSDELKNEIKAHVRAQIGNHAVPSEIEFSNALPKTKSGKIMRRLLLAQELGAQAGDTSTLED